MKKPIPARLMRAAMFAAIRSAAAAIGAAAGVGIVHLVVWLAFHT